MWLCYPNQYWWYRIDARTSMKTRFSSMKRLDNSVNYNLSQSKSIFGISDIQMDWVLVYLVFWREFPHTIPISNKQTNIKGMMFQILTYKSVTNTDIGKLLRLIKTSLSLIITYVFYTGMINGVMEIRVGVDTTHEEIQIFNWIRVWLYDML